VNNRLMEIVGQQLREFRDRGGDDLMAVYVYDEDVSENSAVELVRRSDGRKHVVVVGDGIYRYSVDAWVFDTREVHGIRFVSRDAPQRGGLFEATAADIGKFTESLARMLDANKGRFQPVREEGLALHRDSEALLWHLKDAVPSDGPITIRCNAVPNLAGDAFTFHDASGAQDDFWVRMSGGDAVAYVGHTPIGTFAEKDGFDGLKEVIASEMTLHAGMKP